MDVLPLLVAGLQQKPLKDRRAALTDLRARLRASGRRDTALEEQLVDAWAELVELRLYVATLCRALVRKGVVTADELRDLVAAVDAEDGVPDGAFRGDVLPDA